MKALRYSTILRFAIEFHGLFFFFLKTLINQLMNIFFRRDLIIISFVKYDKSSYFNKIFLSFIKENKISFIIEDFPKLRYINIKNSKLLNFFFLIFNNIKDFLWNISILK